MTGAVQRGHLFVVQGDMARFSADAFIIPCDENLQVTGGWRALVEPGREPQRATDWFIARGTVLRDGLAVLDDTTPKNPTPDEVVGLRVLVDTVGVADIDEMVERALEAVRRAAAEVTLHNERFLPLVALPILGVGAGKFPGRRTEVVNAMVRKLLDFVATHPIDVALVLRRTSDFAAVQWARKQAGEGRELWPELTDIERELADGLGRKAAHGQLSIFVGAGVSQPVGFPSWETLLRDLASPREIEIRKDTNYPRLAEELGLSDRTEEIASRFATNKHALGHAFLANLRTQAMVTTNYDPCLENADAVLHADEPRLVLARQIATGGRPWLLKMHGDLRKPDTIVLTESQYLRLGKEWGALRGVVQSLMLTSHLLFVGFGFADSDFLAMSQAVQRVRELAGDEPIPSVGTAIQLLASDKKRHAELDYHHMGPKGGDLSEAARRLEILLDRMVWARQVEGDARAAFLLDPEFQEGQTKDEGKLRQALTTLRDVVDELPHVAAHDQIQDLLAALGQRSR